MLTSTVPSPGALENRGSSGPYCDENLNYRTHSTPLLNDTQELYTASAFALQTTPVTMDMASVPVKMIFPPDEIPPAEVPNLVLYCIVFFLAVVGNALVIITLLANRRMRTVASCFLLSLSVSDLLLAIFCMPISITGRILKRFIFGTFMCKTMTFLMVTSVSVSTFTMLAISVERYYAICRPLRSRVWQTVSHAYRVIAGVWILSCLLNLPYFFVTEVGSVPLIDFKKCTKVCRPVFSIEGRQAWYLFLLLTLFCIPGILMTVAYTLVSCRIWKEFQVKSNHKGGDVAVDEDHDMSDGLYISSKRNGKSFRMIRNSVKRLVTRETSSIDRESSSTYCCGPPPSSTFATKSDTTVVSPKSNSKFQNKANSSRYQKGKAYSVRNESRSFSPAERLKAKKQVVRMLIVIVILFFVCWTPLFIVNVWKAFDPETAREKLDGYIEIIQLMSYVSACVNPLVYCFMNKQFRAGFLRACLCCCVRRYRTRQTKRTPGSYINED